MNKKQKKLLYRILTAVVLFAAAKIMGTWWQMAEILLLLSAYIVVGYDVIRSAVGGILRGQVFDENFLMVLATLGAWATGEYHEAVFVMIFYQIGDLFEKYAVGKSRNSISELMEICPETAYVLRDGERVEVGPEEVSIGEMIRVSPGEKIPLDGIVREGTASVDTSALTGESMPRDLQAGDRAISGTVNLTGVLTIEVTKEYSESTVSKILEMVEDAADHKARTENFITRFARVYTPLVVIAAVVLAFLPPLLTGQPFSGWIHRALIFLVISCPCALVISVPLGFFGGIGGASRHGILIKGSNYLETLAGVDTVVMDKTGTMTEGHFSVTEVYAETFDKEQLLKAAAYAECYSNHPISVSIKEAYGREILQETVTDVKEIAGLGITAKVAGRRVAVGNAQLMRQVNSTPMQTAGEGTIVHVAVEQQYAGYIRISDTIKEDADAAIKALHKVGIRKTVMLTGDREETARKVAGTLGIDEVRAELLPQDKVQCLEEILSDNQGRTAYVGDGINDAPVLARADVGIAMGALGADAAIEAADVVIMDDKPSQIAVAIRIARKTLKIVKQNIVFALGVKALVLVLGAMGYANMWMAVFADVGVSVIAILNSMRAMYLKK